MEKIITDEQRQQVNDLIKEIGYSDEETVKLLEKFYKKQNLNDLSEKQANLMIHGLAGALEAKKQGNPNWNPLAEKVQEKKQETKSEIQIATPESEISKEYEVGLNELFNLNTSALTEGFNKKRFIRNAMNLMFDPMANKIDWSKLKKEEVLKCLLDGAKYDLEYGREFHIIPRWNSNLKRKCATEMIDYKGYIKIMKKFSIEPIKNIVVGCVFKGDVFEVDMFAYPPIKHKMMFQSDGKDNVTHAYCCIIYNNGSYDPEVLTRKQLDDIEATSKDDTKTFWGTWYTEMAKKSAIRRIQKRVPLEFPDSDMQKAWRDEISSDSDFMNQPKEEHKVIDISSEVSNG